MGRQKGLRTLVRCEKLRRLKKPVSKEGDLFIQQATIVANTEYIQGTVPWPFPEMANSITIWKRVGGSHVLIRWNAYT